MVFKIYFIHVYEGIMFIDEISAEFFFSNYHMLGNNRKNEKFME